MSEGTNQAAALETLVESDDEGEKRNLDAEIPSREAKRARTESGAAIGPSDADTKGISRAKLLHPLSDDEWAEYVSNMKKKRDRRQKRDDAARTTALPIAPKGARTTLDIAIRVYTERCAGKGTPLPADDPVQVEFWEVSQASIYPNRRRIKVMVNGIMKESSVVMDLKLRGTSAETAAACKDAWRADMSSARMGHDVLNAIEGCAINLLVKALKSVSDEWSFEPVFDGLKADLMVRHETFATNEYVPIQVKSAQNVFGRQATYFTRPEKYESWMYCVAIGLRGYAPARPTSFDDTFVPGASLYEVWDVGHPAPLGPSPATAYNTMDKAKRCFFMHDADGYAKPQAFLKQMLSNMLAWKHRFTRNRILYDIEVVNRGMSPKKVPEVLGLQALAEVLPGLRAPWRQEETVDSVWEGIGISNKTTRINNGDTKQRTFLLAHHNYDQFARWVVASYGDSSYQKVAVIPAAVVYGCGKQAFCWNESNPSSMKDVTLFDLRTQADKFRKFLKQ